MVSFQVFPDSAELTRGVLDLFIAQACDSIRSRGLFSVALSGGSTPRNLYANLAAPEHQELLSWADIHLFFGDERHVPPDHPDSNYLMVQETLISQVSIPQNNIHRVKAELDPRIAAFSYEEELRVIFGSEWPRFDLVLLGMGEDGHTASLFPGTAGLNEDYRWFIANYVPNRGEWRLTLTKNAINSARKIIVLVSGRSKAEMVSEVFNQKPSQKQKPIQTILPVDGELVWLLDCEAASLLPE